MIRLFIPSLLLLILPLAALSQNYIDLSEPEMLEKFMDKKWTVTGHKRMNSADSSKGFIPPDDYYEKMKNNMVKNQLTFEFLENNMAKLTANGKTQEMYWKYNADSKSFNIADNEKDTWPITYKIVSLSENKLILYYFPMDRNELYYFSSNVELFSTDERFRNFVKYGTRLLSTAVFDSHDETETLDLSEALKLRFQNYSIEFFERSDKIIITSYLPYQQKTGTWAIKDGKITAAISGQDTVEFILRMQSSASVYLDMVVNKKTYICLFESDQGETTKRSEMNNFNIPIYFKSIIVENQWKIPEGNKPFFINGNEKNLTVSFNYNSTFEVRNQKSKVVRSGIWNMEYNVLFIDYFPCYIDTLGIDKCRLFFYEDKNSVMDTSVLLPVKDHRFNVKNNTGFEGLWIMDSLVFVNGDEKFSEEENTQRKLYRQLMSKTLKSEIKLGEEGSFYALDRKSNEYSGTWQISADKTKLFFNDDATIQDYVFSVRKSGNFLIVRAADLSFEKKYDCEFVLRKK